MHSLRQTGLVLMSLAVTVAFVSDVARAAGDSGTLRGIDKMSVLIEGLDSDSTNYGVTEQMLRTQVELELRRTGIKVVEFKTAPTVPTTLYVWLAAMRHIGSRFHVYTINLELKQDAALRRNPQIIAFYATTWDKRSLNLISSDNYANNVRSTLSKLLDEFLNDYLSVNPK